MMNSYLNYLLEFNICISILGITYYAFLRNETDFNFRRAYLLIGLISSFVAPLLKLGALTSFNTTSTGINSIPTIILPELVVGTGVADVTVESGYSTYLIGLYSVVALILIQVLLFHIFQIIWFAYSRKTRKINEANHTLIMTNGTLPTFSFFRFLFFDNAYPLSQGDIDRIKQHELAHIRLGHSYDIIIIEIAKVISWFNPITWMLKKEIQQVHEYQADQVALKISSVDEYSSLLAKMALDKAHLSLGHHFNKSQTLKRITMIKQFKKKISMKKLAVILPIFLITILVVSCNDEVMKDIDNTMETATQMEVPISLQPKLKELQNAYPDADFAYIETAGGKKESVDNLKDVDPNSIAYIQVFEKEDKIGIFINKNGAIKKAANTPDANGVYTLVDETAKPKGGFQQYYMDLAQNLVYPSQAKDAGVEGKVYVQFIVNADGNVTDVSAVKGIGAGCDAAAVEAVKNTSTWSAPIQDGKAVKQRIILPITFKLDGNQASSAANNPAKSLTVKGQVTNGIYAGQVLSESGKPLPGVNIVVRGSQLATVSDINGQFKIMVSDADEVLFSFIGMKTTVKKI